jgi:transcriptional regulator GlxA family with amidase domain
MSENDWHLDAGMKASSRSASQAQSRTPQINVLFVVEPNILLLDIAGPAEAFRSANSHLRSEGRAERFQLRFVSAQPSQTSSVGSVFGSLEPLPRLDPWRHAWVVLVGKPTAEYTLSGRSPVDHEVVQWLQREVKPHLCLAPDSQSDPVHRVRIVTICEGALVAARAGLMDRRCCTTHHEVLAALRTSAPSARVVDNRVYVIDGPVASCAGAAAGLDLALALVASECGESIASKVAVALNVYVRRGPNDPELSPTLRYRNHLSAVVHRVQDAISTDPHRQWSATELAAVASTSVRHLDRLFVEHVGVLPRMFLQSVRLERARLFLAQGATVTEAAVAGGFTSDQQLRRAWHRTFGHPPTQQ